MKLCPTYLGSCFVNAVADRDIVHPDATGLYGEPLALCQTCEGVGAIPDPLVPRDRGVDSYRPLR